MDIDIDHLRGWIGREERGSEVLTPNLMQQFNATFDRNQDAHIGQKAPLLIHLCLAQPAVPMSQLGRDGHPELGGFLPPVPLPRRMWAGGHFDFHDDVHVGDTVTRRSVIKDVVLKQGRTGPLCFVTVEHEISSDGRLILNERQDIVYRDATPTRGPVKVPPTAVRGADHRCITPTPTLLFRYSAMTFNGHRIHYDRSFATEDEGYPGLVVHGPMQATMLCQYAADLHGVRPNSFAFRSLSPIFDTADFTLNAEPSDRGLKLWTATSGGPVAMEAHASW